MTYQYQSSRPIAAFSMADYESLTGRAEFGRGKDKTKRKKRGLLANVGIGAAGLAGAGALGAGVRYGGAAASTALAQRRLYNGAGGSKELKGQKMNINTARNAQSGGARGQLNRDIDAVKDLGSRVKNYDYKGAPGRALESIKSAPGRIGSAAKSIPGKVSNLGKGLASSVMRRPKTSAALALGGAAALGGAGYGAYKMLSNRKKKNKK